MFFVKNSKGLSYFREVVVAQNRFLHDYLKLEISGESFQFPHVWLRDNCRCDQCFHHSAQSRIIDWVKFDLNTKPKVVFQDEDSVKVTWSDDHKSVYRLNWLKFRSFFKQNQRKYSETIYKPARKTWNDVTFKKAFTKHDYSEILKCDKALYDWLDNFSVYGVALIQKTPSSDTAIDALVEKVAFPKKTHFGSKFVVQSGQKANHVAYLTNSLQMHTDLSYYEYGPGANVLHYQVQTESLGGDSLLSDGHFVAEYMKEYHPQQYKILTEVDVEWHAVGEEHGNAFFKLHRAPVIQLNINKEISRIHFSVSQRSSNFPGPIENVVPWYEAYHLFLKLNHRFSSSFKIKTGDILVFDNTRLLHGRKAYEDKNNNVRKIIGVYLDWDEIYSRLRCLTVKLKNEDGM